jgi:glycosyltransferase involved in cell wall biosynthesis
MTSKKFAVIHNSHGSFDGKSLGSREEKYEEIRLIFMGRLIPQKNIEQFFELTADVVRTQKTRPIKICVYGDWQDAEYKRQIQRYIVKLGIESFVSFYGFSDHRTIFAQNNMNFLFHTTGKQNPEPFGRVLLDAISAGAIVLTNGYGGAGEIIKKGKNGYIFSGEPADYIRKIVDYYDQNPKMLRRDSSKFYGFSAELFLVRRQSTVLSDLLRSLKL